MFVGHKYAVTQQLTPVARRLCCDRCWRMFAMNDEVRCVVHWNSAFHAMYESFGIEVIYQEHEGKRP